MRTIRVLRLFARGEQAISFQRQPYLGYTHVSKRVRGWWWFAPYISIPARDASPRISSLFTPISCILTTPKKVMPVAMKNGMRGRMIWSSRRQVVVDYPTTR